MKTTIEITKVINGFIIESETGKSIAATNKEVANVIAESLVRCIERKDYSRIEFDVTDEKEVV